MPMSFTDVSNTGLGNSLVLSGNKPLHEPMLTQIYAAMVSLGRSDWDLRGVSKTHMSS